MCGDKIKALDARSGTFLSASRFHPRAFDFVPLALFSVHCAWLIHNFLSRAAGCWQRLCDGRIKVLDARTGAFLSASRFHPLAFRFIFLALFSVHFAWLIHNFLGAADCWQGLVWRQNQSARCTHMPSVGASLLLARFHPLAFGFISLALFSVHFAWLIHNFLSCRRLLAKIV